MRALVFALLLSGIARAQSNERHVDDVEAVIKQGGIAALHDKIAPGVASTPEWARRICAAAAESPLDAGLRVKDDLKAAAEKIRQIGVRASEENPDSADAWCATADGTYFRVRVLRACGEETTTEDWLAVIDALKKQQELAPKDDSGPLERAVKYLREGRRAKGVDKDALKKREDEVCAEGVKLFPKSAFFAGIAQNAELEEVVALLDANGHKEAKPRLAALLANAPDDTAYNDAVTVAKQHFKKLGIKADYRTKPREYANVLDYIVPTGERWKVESDAIRQYGRDGKLVRKFSLDWYKQNVNYTLGDTEYDGSNAKGMALISERDVLSVIVKTQRKTGIIKKTMNRNISGVQYFVIGGWDKDGDFVRFHTYLWKNDERQITLRLWIIEFQDLEDFDPEAQLVIDSFRESK